MRKQRQLRRSKKRKTSVKSPKKSFRPPRTAEELFARPKQFQDLWDRAVQVPAEMRRLGLSLWRVSHKFRISPTTVLLLTGSAFTKKRGRYIGLSQLTTCFESC
jgi:hypothetical protein